MGKSGMIQEAEEDICKSSCPRAAGSLCSPMSSEFKGFFNSGVRDVAGKATWGFCVEAKDVKTQAILIFSSIYR